MFFDNMIKEIKETPEPEKVVINFSDNPHTNVDILKSKIDMINAMSNDELFRLLNICYPSIIDDVNSGRMEYVKAYINPKFINQFARVIGTTDINIDKKRACSKLAYMYHIAKSNNKSESTVQLYKVLVKLAYRDIVPILVSLGITESMAIDLVIARYSSDNDVLNVRRVNFVIQNSPINILSIQIIVKIYEKLFDRMTPLFKGTMFDVLDEDEEWVTESIIEIDSMISLSVLELLNNMTFDQIRQVIISYVEDYTKIFNCDNHCYRFSLVALSDDYYRVVETAEKLRYEGYLVP